MFKIKSRNNKNGVSLSKKKTPIMLKLIVYWFVFYFGGQIYFSSKYPDLVNGPENQRFVLLCLQLCLAVFALVRVFKWDFINKDK